MSDVDNEGGCACVEAKVYGKPLPSSQFCGKPKTLKKQSLIYIFLKTQHENTRLKELNLNNSPENWRAKKGSEGLSNRFKTALPENTFIRKKKLLTMGSWPYLPLIVSHIIVWHGSF